MVIDPVCHLDFDPEEAAVTLSYGEETYFFCSFACRDRFLEDPSAWLLDEADEDEMAEEL